MPTIYFAWMTSFLYGVSSIIAKITANNSVKNPWVYNFIWTVITVIFIMPFALYYGIGIPDNWTSVIIMGIASALAGTTYILAMMSLDVSILSPFYMLRNPIIVLLGIVLFGESLSVLQTGCIVLMVISGMLIGFDEKFSVKSIFRPQMGYAFLAVITSALFNVSVKYASGGNSFWDVTFWPMLVTLVCILPTYPLFARDLRRTPVRHYAGIAWSTVFGTAGFLISVLALRDAVGIASAVISLPFSMVLAVALSFVAPKLLEKHTMKVYAIRIASAAVMFISALFLSK